jgi:hypothetical protein
LSIAIPEEPALTFKILPATLLLLTTVLAVPICATAHAGTSVPQFALNGPIPISARAALYQALARRPDALSIQPFGVPTWLEQKVTADDGVTGDALGFSVAIDGDTALIGATQGTSAPTGVDNGGAGAVYVFTNQGGTWTQTQKLTAADGVDNDQFGYFVALRGDLAVVGAAFATVGSNGRQGAVYVFDRNGASWSQAQKLVADDGAISDQLGWSVATDGVRIAAGAPGVSVNGNFATGAVYVFDNDGTTWSQTTKLTADDGAGADDFGFSVAIHGNRVLASALGAAVGGNAGQGAAYVFDDNTGTWTQSQKIFANDGAANENFGFALAYDGTNAIVGAPFATVGANMFQGAAYTFTEDTGGLVQSQKLAGDDGQVFDVLGIAVSIDGDDAVATAPFFNGSQGTAYLFHNMGADGWVQQQKFVASDAIAGEGAAFGYAGAVSAGVLLIGQPLSAINDNAYQGAAYFYHQPPPDRIFVDGFDGP